MRAVVFVLHLYELALLVRIICSWVMPHPRHEALRLLFRITDPYLNVFRKALPFLVFNGIDFSPIVAFLVLHLVASVLR